jgi:hypothetical protein
MRKKLNIFLKLIIIGLFLLPISLRASNYETPKYWKKLSNSDIQNTNADKAVNVNSKIIIGTNDAYGRGQIWNYLPSSVFRLGSAQTDGDPTNAESEGIVVYGKNIPGDAMGTGDFGYARIKVNRMGLYSYDAEGSLQNYYFRVDPTSLYLRNDSSTKTFEVNRSNGNTTISGSLGVGIASPATSAKVDITSTTGALLIPRMTTAQRDALTAVNGMIVYNSTTNAFNFYENGAWVTK